MRFMQLDERAKQRVRDRFGDWNVDSTTEWWDDVTAWWSQSLEKLGFSEVRIEFTGFCSQGDGARFLAKFRGCDYVAGREAIESDIAGADLPKAMQELLAEMPATSIAKLVRRDVGECLLDQLSGEVRGVCGHYVHERTARFNWYADVDEERHPRIANVVYEFRKDMETFRRRVCQELYKALEEQYDYLTSDAALEEAFIANGMHFDETGREFDPRAPDVQRARFICEADAAGAFTKDVIMRMAESMDVIPEAVLAGIDEAAALHERHKKIIEVERE